MLGVATASEYLEHLTTRGNRDAELRLLLNEITIGETYMFRHPAQLDALRTVILPQILQMKGLISLKRLRFWCAGCSTGEEPHTLAMPRGAETLSRPGLEGPFRLAGCPAHADPDGS